jgi:glycosyltransferase involved in cell wall biosynthesis
MSLHVVHTIPGLKETSGGVSRSVPGLCAALAEAGCAPVLVSQNDRNTPGLAARLPPPGLVRTRLIEGYDWPGLRMSFTPGLARVLASVCAEGSPCVLHDHGLWLHMNHVAAQVAGRLGLKRVVSPRGMLDEWSLKYRGLKKKAAWALYQRHDLATASAFSTTSVREAESIRALGFAQPIAVIPNGIDLPLAQIATERLSGLRSVVFMSRIHPKKGLLDLVAAWARVDRTGWRLVIAGPDEAGHQAEVEAAVLKAALGASISFVGQVEGEAKSRLLSSADLFVLPTYSENFGIVIGEALAYGVPVITTTVTPWAALRENACGWWTDVGVLPLAQALNEAFKLNDAERAEMGARGRKLIAERYSWRSVAERHIELYDWLAAGSAKPHWLFA